MNYVPHTDRDRKNMLETIGVESTDRLFDVIPSSVRLKQLLNLPPELSEHHLLEHLSELANKNLVPSTLSFLGAGAYRHFVPAVVDTILSRSEFMTAYTPYQPEVSQGTLQTIFEFQSMMCDLTGMDVCNASVYDGGCATIDAVYMAMAITGRKKVVVSEGIHPQTLELLHTYLETTEGELVVVPLRQGLSTGDGIDAESACYVFQNPNFLGYIEDANLLCQKAKEAGALSINALGDAVSLAVLKTPGDCGADICVGDAQPLGLPVSFGGPYAGFVACKKPYLRRIPGRLCGITVDTEGRRGFCLTLQAREQHIRRDKAYSNICTNQGLCALGVTVHLALLGPQGLKEVATTSCKLANYFKREITKLDGFSVPYAGAASFHEILVKCPSAELVNQHLESKGIVGGYAVGPHYPNNPELAETLLFCFTELNDLASVHTLLNELANAGKLNSSSKTAVGVA
jgi:glycine dehydrogenase subunit 1